MKILVLSVEACSPPRVNNRSESCNDIQPCESDFREKRDVRADRNAEVHLRTGRGSSERIQEASPGPARRNGRDDDRAPEAGRPHSVNGLGTLEVRQREARTGRNPATGEMMQIAASKKVAFRPAKELKEAV